MNDSGTFCIGEQQRLRRAVRAFTARALKEETLKVQV